jgi:putative protease
VAKPDPVKVTSDLPQPPVTSPVVPQIIPLVRRLDQLEAVLDLAFPVVYCELEDPRRYREAVTLVRRSSSEIFVAPPRITKPGEQWILEQVYRCKADGYLLRNYDHLSFFQGHRAIADFSYNIANPLTAAYFKAQFPFLERLTASYDLNGHQLVDLAAQVPPHWLEVTLHQYMPLFHMEHCVFCAFLSEGTDHTNCGRPCEKHHVKLRDRVGVEHILQADAGCRNTVFNGTAQSGAEWLPQFQSLGLRHFRVEFLQESPQQVQHILTQYHHLIQGHISGGQLWKQLRHSTGALQRQLGVTRGTMG